MEAQAKVTGNNGTIGVERGEESYEVKTHIQNGLPANRYIYIYHSYSGAMFYTDQATIKECRAKRDEWLRGLHD